MCEVQEEFTNAIYHDKLKEMDYILYRDIDIEALLQKGITTCDENNYRVRYNYTPLLWACEFHSIESVELLLRHNANVNVQLRGFDAPIFKEADKGVEKQTIREWQENKMETPLVVAIQRNSLPLVKLLLENGANPNIYNENDYSTTLCYASAFFAEAVQILIDYGADVNAKHKLATMTPLDFAVSDNNINAARILLENGARITVEEQVEATHLYTCVEYGYPEMLKLMLNFHSVDFVYKKITFYFILIIDSDNIELARILLDYSEKNALNILNNDFFEAFEENCSPAMLDLLKEGGRRLNKQQ